MFGRLRFLFGKILGACMGTRKDNEKKYKQIINEYKKEVKEKGKEIESADSKKTGEFSANADLLGKDKSSKKKVFKVKVNKILLC